MASDQSVEIRRVLTRRCASLGIPISGIFELTPRCNLRCKMCYVRLTPAQMAPIGTELTAQQWLELAREAREAGLTFLLLTGGEPTLRSDFEEIYAELAQMGFSISINTNGTLLTPSLRRLWHSFPPSQVNVTLYGTSREDYNTLCGDPDAFDRVVEALQWLKSEGILVHLNTTIVPENMASWERLEQFGDALGIGLRMTTYCFPPVRREVCGVCDGFRRITAEEAGNLTVRDILYREGVESIRKRAASMSAPPSSDCRLDTGESISCMAGRAQFWVNWYGGMTPCGMLPEPQVHPMAEGFPAAWDRLRQQTAQIRLCPECSTCKERHTCMNCAAVIYTETGTFTEKPEYMCWLNRAYRQALKQYSGEELSPFFPQ